VRKLVNPLISKIQGVFRGNKQVKQQTRFKYEIGKIGCKISNQPTPGIDMGKVPQFYIVAQIGRWFIGIDSFGKGITYQAILYRPVGDVPEVALLGAKLNKPAV